VCVYVCVSEYLKMDMGSGGCDGYALYDDVTFVREVCLCVCV